MNTRFYQNLKPFSQFSGITEDRHFEPVPPDWCVVITDVKGSTNAIEQGRYKDVNTIGAASIVAVQNALTDMEFPFVFGGDGATLLVPGSCRDLVARKLGALKTLSARNFGLDLRVGIVDVAEILQQDKTIEVAKFELVPGNCVAIIRGGGLNLAEHLVKDDGQQHEVPAQASATVDLAGLSCRWRDIPNQRGCVLSMLVAAREGTGQKQVYQNLLNELKSIFPHPLVTANPVKLSSMSYCSVGECARHEGRFQGRWSLGWLLRLLEIVLAVVVFKGKHLPRLPGFKRYAESMHEHSDYRKFDDMLRMIIDCSPSQVDDLTRYLEQARQRGDLHYGLHQSDTALMTCYVHSLQPGDHIHFIDGGNGGYAMAARQLKAQMSH